MANLRCRADAKYPVTLQQFKESFPNISFGTQIDVTQYGYDVVFDTPMPNLTAIQKAVEDEPRFDPVAGLWYQTWLVSDVTDGLDIDALTELVTNLKTQRLEELANYRYSVETAGITCKGFHIATDRVSQQSISSTITLFALNPGGTVDWSASQGFVQLDLPTLKAIGTAVHAYVQSCRSYEKQIYTQIQAIASSVNSTTAQRLLAIDITQGWPSNVSE